MFDGAVGVELADDASARGTVLLRRKVRGRSKVVRRGTLTRRNPPFGFDFPRRRGRYRAILTPQTIPTLGKCPRTKSDWVKIKRRKPNRA